MARDREYPIDNEIVRREQFERLTRLRKIEVMRQWFLSRYIGSADNTSRVSGDNTRRHNVEQILQDEFADIATTDVIRDAAEQITEKRTKGARVATGGRTRRPVHFSAGNSIIGQAFAVGDAANESKPPRETDTESGQNNVELPELPPRKAFLTDQDGKILTDQDGNPLIVDVGVPPNKTDDAALRAEITEHLEILEKAVSELRDLARRTHNNPPELLAELGDPEGIAIEIQIQIRSAKRLVADTVPPSEEVKQLATTFRSLAERVRRPSGWLIPTITGGITYDIFKILFLNIYNTLCITAHKLTIWAEALRDIQ